MRLTAAYEAHLESDAGIRGGVISGNEGKLLTLT
jgi:hypothetical protein